ncbi:MAG TPA: efflux RND transporter periplasmic adaptor subunit [Gemmatimonadaceae bacterium]|nr:efflux RND transporter periplasmic adaptor subunit [Gemmatimonadaceae bacterium]
MSSDSTSSTLAAATSLVENRAQGVVHDRLTALRAGVADLAAAGSTLEIPPIALRIALAATDSPNGSFWRATAAGWECHVASGPQSSGLAGRVVPMDEVFTESEDGRVIVAALAPTAGAAPFAALRVWRESDAAPFHPDIDREWLAAVAVAAAAAFVADARLRQADRSTDVALLAEMSREIASTLDIDRVLRLAVNLAARAVPFDRGAIALYDHGHCDVRAIAGVTSIDPEDPAVRDIAARGEWAAGTGEGFYLSDRDAPGSDAERIFVQIFGEDLAAANAESGLYLPLKDEEGVLGVLVLESAHPDFANAREREITDVLAAQVTVAIRNAQLYAQIPLAATIGAFTSRGRALLELPRRRRALAAGIAVVVLAALTLIRWPLRVVGDTPVLSALDPVEARALVDGVVERILVTEGVPVQRGMALAQLRDADARTTRDAVLSERDVDVRTATLAASRGDAAQEQLFRERAASLQREADVLDNQLNLAVVRAAVDGVVLTAHPEQRVGLRLAAGDPLLLVGRTDTLELNLGVAEADLALVHVGEEVRLRVDALPGRTFTGRVAQLAELPAARGDGVDFPVRALVPNTDGALRPGMTAYARVLGARTSVAGRVLRRPIRGARLLWWRLWS